MAFTPAVRRAGNHSRMEYTCRDIQKSMSLPTIKVGRQGFGDYPGRLGWHTDSSYLEKPAPSCTMPVCAGSS